MENLSNTIPSAPCPPSKLMNDATLSTPEVREPTKVEQLEKTKALLESYIVDINTLIDWINTYSDAEKILSILKFAPYINVPQRQNQP